MGTATPDLVVPMQGNNKAEILLDTVTHTVHRVGQLGQHSRNGFAQYRGGLLRRQLQRRQHVEQAALTASKATTTLALRSFADEQRLRTTVTLTATLSPYAAGSLTTPARPITFKNGSTTLGTGTLSGRSQPH